MIMTIKFKICLKKFKWIKCLSTRSETIKLLEENIGEKPHDIGLGNDFLHMTPKRQKIKVKTDK